jgi:hypothetical protein
MSRVSRAWQRANGGEGAAESDARTDPIPWDLSELSTGDEPMPLLARKGTLSLPAEHDGGGAEGEMAQHLRGLVQRVFLSPSATGPAIRSVLFCPVDGTPGASSTCRAAAEGLASLTAKSVCLLGRTESALRAVAPPADGGAKRLSRNLWLAPSGHLHTGEGSEARLVQLQGRFDYLIVDAAAFAGLHDAAVLGGMVDGVLLILDERVTRREVARRVADTLQAAGGRLLGVVLTNRSYPIPERVYRLL